MTIRLIPFLLFWLLHILASVAAFLWHYSVSFSRFNGHAVAPGVLRISGLLNDVLSFPLAGALASVMPLSGVFGWLPVLINNALWAAGLSLAWRHYRRRR